jgi:hypothetical protein
MNGFNILINARFQELVQVDRLIANYIGAEVIATFALSTLVVVAVEVGCPRNLNRLVRQEQLLANHKRASVNLVKYFFVISRSCIVVADHQHLVATEFLGELDISDVSQYN